MSVEKWKLIPTDSDIILTHGPPFLQGDITMHGKGARIEKHFVGCKDLKEKVNQVKPQFYIAGHLHEGWGVSKDVHNNITTFINAATVNTKYRVNDRTGHMFNPPILFKVKKPSENRLEL